MENEINFSDFPKVSIKSLLDDNFIETISIVENQNGNAKICLIDKEGKKVIIAAGKITAQKMKQKNFNEEDLRLNGSIALINSPHSLTNLRFYITEYVNIFEVDELDQMEKVELENQSKLIKAILLKNGDQSA